METKSKLVSAVDCDGVPYTIGNLYDGAVKSWRINSIEYHEEHIILNGSDKNDSVWISLGAIYSVEWNSSQSKMEPLKLTK